VEIRAFKEDSFPELSFPLSIFASSKKVRSKIINFRMIKFLKVEVSYIPKSLRREHDQVYGISIERGQWQTHAYVYRNSNNTDKS
jgi:hypothetical protein